MSVIGVMEYSLNNELEFGILIRKQFRTREMRSKSDSNTVSGVYIKR